MAGRASRRIWPDAIAFASRYRATPRNGSSGAGTATRSRGRARLAGDVDRSGLAPRRARRARPVLLSDWLIEPDIAAGRLIDLFPKHEVTATNFDTAVSLLYASREHVPRRVRAFLSIVKGGWLESDSSDRELPRALRLTQGSNGCLAAFIFAFGCRRRVGSATSCPKRKFADLLTSSRQPSVESATTSSSASAVPLAGP